MYWLVLAIVLWGAVHSLTASHAFKNTARHFLGDNFSHYFRLIYNVFSLLSFIPLLLLISVWPDQLFYQVPYPWNLWMRGVQGFSLFFLVYSVIQTDALSFAGLRQLVDAERPPRLVTSGLYRYMRHPLYTFGLLFIWFTPRVSINLFVLYVTLTIYIFIGTYFEERKLLLEFGDDYAAYKSTTPMLVPGKKFGRNK